MHFADDGSWTNPDEDENGIDLERLRRNRALTPKERLEQHRRACESVLALREAAQAARRRRVRQNPP
jgi:hypothetical protein